MTAPLELDPQHAPRQLHLNLNALHSGFVPSAWRLSDSDPLAFANVQHYVRLARIAEAGKFDAIFLADNAAIADQINFRPITALEPTVLLACVAAATTHIGLVGTASTSYNEPYNIARRFATLDHVSGGRAGWNMVTTADLARRATSATTPCPTMRSAMRAPTSSPTVVRALWDSWEDDAFIGDKGDGRFVDVRKVQPIAHRGASFSVQGPLNLPRSAQGHPVLFQAGGSADGRELAARHAEAVFSAAQSIENPSRTAAGSTPWPKPSGAARAP